MPQEYIILRDLDLEIDFLDEKRKVSFWPRGSLHNPVTLHQKSFFFFLLGEDENISEKELIFQLQDKQWVADLALPKGLIEDVPLWLEQIPDIF